MEYAIYKFEFSTGVHFGTGMLNESAYTFQADQLFSALYIESLKLGLAEDFYQSVKNGRLLFSDAFPYVKNQYMVPKPMLYVMPEKEGDSKQKKAYKKLKYIPVDLLDSFLTGTLNPNQNNPMRKFGSFQQQTMASVRNDDETTPYRVGTFYYNADNGLYIILAYESSRERMLAEDLLESLSYAGIGGKKASGLGRYTFILGKDTKSLLDRLHKKEGRYLLLSTALPADSELEHVLENASYLLTKRSGFIASQNYADEWRRKKDLYVFQAGSCFTHPFLGDIYDVACGGAHPVYRYAMPVFMRI